MRSAPVRNAFAVGAVALFVVALAGCYDVPRPECGFQCGPPAVAGGDGTCPDGYVCFTDVDNRCHRMSPPFTEPCPGDAAVPVDLTPPLLTFRSPAPDDANVPLDGFIEIGFTEPVNGVDFPNVVVEEAGTIITFSVSASAANHYQITPLTQLGGPRAFLSATAYTVRLTEGIMDFSGNAFVGEEWSFTTETDTTPPTVLVQSPSSLVGVNVQTLVELQFSEAVTNVNIATFTLTGPSGAISASVSTNGSPTTFATLDPFVPLDPNTQYTIALSSSIVDLAGNPLTFTPMVFTTAADTTRPAVASTNPASGSFGVPVNAGVAVGFTEIVTGVSTSTFTLSGPSGLIAATVGSASTSASLDPIHQLQPNTTYSVSLTTAIVDLVNNPLIAFTGSFTTGSDAIPPGLIARSPAPGATGRPVDTVVQMDFDEDVTNADGTTIQLIGASAVPAVVSYMGAPMFRATLTPSVQLAANTTYTVDIASTLQDASGNLFGTPPTSWTFTTGTDMVVPHVVTTAPADNATDVALATTISVTFDEPVVGVDGTSFVVMNAGTGTLASSNGGRTWTFTPDVALPASTTVTIMLTMAIVDAAGNALVPFAFDFTTVP